jgi:hypothetical protein
MSSEIQSIQRKIKKGKSLPLYEVEELQYMQKPIGKALYKHYLGEPTELTTDKRIIKDKSEIIIPVKKSVGRPKSENPTHWSDRIKCKICNKIFIRSARSKHSKTEVHQAYAKMNEKMMQFMINEN